MKLNGKVRTSDRMLDDNTENWTQLSIHYRLMGMYLQLCEQNRRRPDELEKVLRRYQDDLLDRERTIDEQSVMITSLMMKINDLEAQLARKRHYPRPPIAYQPKRALPPPRERSRERDGEPPPSDFDRWRTREVRTPTEGPHNNGNNGNNGNNDTDFDFDFDRWRARECCRKGCDLHRSTN